MGVAWLPSAREEQAAQSLDISRDWRTGDISNEEYVARQAVVESGEESDFLADENPALALRQEWLRGEIGDEEYGSRAMEEYPEDELWRAYSGVLGDPTVQIPAEARDSMASEEAEVNDDDDADDLWAVDW